MELSFTRTTLLFILLIFDYILVSMLFLLLSLSFSLPSFLWSVKMCLAQQRRFTLYCWPKQLDSTGRDLMERVLYYLFCWSPIHSCSLSCT